MYTENSTLQPMQVCVIGGLPHIRVAPTGIGVPAYVPLQAQVVRPGVLRVRAVGPRPALRSLRGTQPQVQACRLPTAHPATQAALGHGEW